MAKVSCEMARVSPEIQVFGHLQTLPAVSLNLRFEGQRPVPYQHGASPHELEPRASRGLKARSIPGAFNVRSSHPNGSGLQPSIPHDHGTQAVGLGWYGIRPLALKIREAWRREMAPKAVN